MDRILVIDDDELVRQALVEMIAEGGYAVTAAENGRKGVAQFCKAPAALVVTDIIMPQQDGIETILELRKIAPRLPIIAISGGGQRLGIEFLDAAQKLGADIVLPKPVREAGLLDGISYLLSKSHLLSKSYVLAGASGNESVKK